MAGLADLSDDELKALAGGANDSPLAGLSDDELRAMAGSPAEPSQIGAYGAAYARQMGLAARDQIGGLAKGVTGLGTLPVDAAVNVGYGAHKLLSKTGAVAEPNADFYYGKGKGYFPTSEGMSDAIDQGLDATGLPKPDPGAEGIVSGVRQGVTGALGPAGLGRLVRGGVGAFLSAEPGVQAAAGGAAGGAGAAIDANPDIAKIADNVPGGRLVAPLAAGLLTGTGISAARAFGGHVPGFGSVRTGSTEMRDALGNSIIQGIADDPRAAANNLRARTRFEESPDFVAPGYQEVSTNAAGDTGLAAARQPLGDMAGGALAERMQGNNAALTRAFTREGADDLAGDAAHRQASAMAGDNLGRFGLAGPTAAAQEPVNVTPFMQQLRRDQDPRAVGTTAQTRAAAREIQGEVRAVGEYAPVPAAGAGMGPRNDFMALPERLQSVRQSVSESLAPARAGSTPALPSVANARGYTGRQLGNIDEILGGAVDPILGPGGQPLSYEASLAARRGLRQEGNERSFMAALMEKLAPGTNAVTGAREFSAPKMSRLGNMRQQEASVPGGGNMSIERLNPARQEFLDRIQNIGETANFGNSAGTSSRGASTARTSTTAGQIGNTIKANAAPYEKLLDFAGRNGLTILGRIPGAGQLAAGGLRGLGRLYQMGAQDGIPDAATAVRGRLGRFETDRPAAIEMLTGRTVPERGLGVSAARQTGRTARYTGQGFLAGQLDSQGERRRRRPYGM
jgi:hypothetical protein